MSNIVKEAIDSNTDLYSILQFDNVKDQNYSLQNISTSDIKRKYKMLALKYHPDKNILTSSSSEPSATHFHDISIAFQILSNDNLRSIYDNWYNTNYRPTSQIKNKQNDKRSKLINNLLRNESTIHNLTPQQQQFNKHHLSDIQRDSIKLRKLKQLNSHPISHNNKWKDSSTLKIILMKDYPSMKRETILHELLPSSLNINMKTDIITETYWHNNNSTIYITFNTPSIALKIWNQWKSSNNNNNHHHDQFIKNITPMKDITFYTQNQTFLDETDFKLSQKLDSLLSADPQIITETIIIN